MNKRLLAVAVAVIAVVLIAAVVLSSFDANLGSQAASGRTVMQAAQDDGNCTQFVQALNVTGLSGTLNGSGPYTVLAPTDAAFDALNRTSLSGMIKGKANLANVVKFHIVPGEVKDSQLTNNMTMKTLQGSQLLVVKNGTGTYVGGARVLNETNCSNGVLMIVDQVLLPRTVADVLAGSADLTMFYLTLVKANLSASLNGPAPFTVFAPLDNAFNATDGDLIRAALDNNDTVTLTKLLTYHIVPYRVAVGYGTASSLLKTVEGSYLDMNVDGSGTSINGAMVVTQDIICSNGVIHVIDRVLSPPSTDNNAGAADGSAEIGPS
jgi:transforming growth factor-beta-induced protein